MKEFTFEAAGLRWGGLEWGPADGTLVVALHGWLDNAASFTGVAPTLAARGLRIVALDLPGHGRTAPLGGMGHGYRPPMHFLDYEPLLHAALEALSSERPVRLLGHSMGAGIALMYAGTFPERVERLALIEGIGPITGTEAEGPERLRHHTEALLPLLAKRSAREGRPSVFSRIDEIVEKRAKAGDLREDSARVLIERAMEQGADGWTWRTDPMLRLPGPYRMTEGQVVPFLERVECPALLFVAERGFPHEFEQAKARLARIRNLRVERVPGGHHVHLDDPAVIAPKLAEFLV